MRPTTEQVQNLLKLGPHIYSRRLSYFDTDPMGILHHSNHLRLFEEARVDWVFQIGLNKEHHPEGDQSLAVLEARARYLKGALVFSEPRVLVFGQSAGLKVNFQYVMLGGQDSLEVLATGSTEHVLVDQNLRPRRLTSNWVNSMRSLPWTETWPWNL